MWRYFGPEGGLSERRLTSSPRFVSGIPNRVAHGILTMLGEWRAPVLQVSKQVQRATPPVTELELELELAVCQILGPCLLYPRTKNSSLKA